MAEFGIYGLKAGAGQLAISPMPGRNGDYGADFAAILDWGPAIVLSMTEEHELAVGFHSDLIAAGINVAHMPIVDFDVPDADNTSFDGIASECLAALRDGRRVLVHCMGGCGRSGMAALRLMIMLGEGPDAALSRLRAVRPCAVETADQLTWAQRD